MKRLTSIIILLACVMSGFGQGRLDKNILVDPATYHIDVYLQPRSLSGWDVKSNWTVITISGAGDVQKVELASVDHEVASDIISLTPSDPAPVKNAAQLIVRFGEKDIALVSLTQPSPGPVVKPTSNKQSSDLYLSGTYSPAINSSPQYQLDGFVALMKDIDANHLNYGQAGVVGSVITDKRKQVDPDSYRIFGAYQNPLSSEWHGPLQGVLLTWLVGGAEFDRKGKDANFITAPYLDFPIRLFPKVIHATTEPMAILTLTTGIEAGYNFHNAVSPDAGRGIFRGVAGGNLLFRFNPKLPGFKGVELSSAYTVRLPAVDEIFTSTKLVDGQSVDVPFLGNKARHYIKQELDFKLNDFFSLTFKHEYGALPPVFRMVDHKASVGFAFSLRQVRDGVPTTIRDK
jgi:hypothetical protein